MRHHLGLACWSVFGLWVVITYWLRRTHRRGYNGTPVGTVIPMMSYKDAGRKP